ncbi:MAG: 30S ribosomal protein S17 [Spirochaetaceae bacterium]|nr:30S ribosomal protein S17 [Spirochaetaceae bacterium]
MENRKTNKKVFTGLVVSDKMDKTIVVKITTKVLHPLYKKYLTKSVKYKAHDENNDAKTGDTVKIIECRPISKEKCWNMQEVIERAK